MSTSRIHCLAWLVPLLMLSGLLAPIGAREATPSLIAGGDWRAAVRQFAAEHLKHPAWGYSHCVRDCALARALAAEDHVAIDDDVLYAAAYLHDIGALAPLFGIFAAGVM